MDKRLDRILSEESSSEAIAYDWGVIAGFQFAIDRLRANKFYGHYATNLVDWLEKHLTEEVKEPTITSLKGDK